MSWGTSSAWQARHLCSVLGALIFRIFAMRSDTGLDSTMKARECLSCAAQMLYSFCGMRVSDLGRTLPWQLLAAQPPGPLNMPGLRAVAPDGAGACGFCGAAMIGATAVRDASASVTIVQSSEVGRHMAELPPD